MRGRLPIADMARAFGQHLTAAQRIVENIGAGHDDALFGHLHQHAPPIAHHLAEIPGNAGFDYRIVDVRYDRQAGIVARGEDMRIDALVFVAGVPVEDHCFPGGVLVVIPCGIELDIEPDEPLRVGQAPVPLRRRARPRDLEFDGHVGDLVAGELADHRLRSTPAAAFLELADA